MFGAVASTCAVCGGAALRAHLRVAGDAGTEGLIPTTDRFGTALDDIVRCEACGHMQLARFPTDTELAQAYADAASDDYVEEEAGQRETARRVLERIERHAARGALVDLGCWVGFLLAEARDRGWETVGVEPSAFASQYARERLGLDVRHLGTAPKAFSVRYYLERIGGYSPGVARGLVRATEAAGIADRMWASDFRDRMLVIAART